MKLKVLGVFNFRKVNFLKYLIMYLIICSNNDKNIYLIILTFNKYLLLICKNNNFYNKKIWSTKNLQMRIFY